MRLAAEALAGADVDFSFRRRRVPGEEPRTDADGGQGRGRARGVERVRARVPPGGVFLRPGENAGPGVPAEDDLSLVAVAEDDPFSSRGQKRRRRGASQ